MHGTADRVRKLIHIRWLRFGWLQRAVLAEAIRMVVLKRGGGFQPSETLAWTYAKYRTGTPELNLASMNRARHDLIRLCSNRTRDQRT